MDMQPSNFEVRGFAAAAEWYFISWVIMLIMNLFLTLSAEN